MQQTHSKRGNNPYFITCVSIGFRRTATHIFPPYSFLCGVKNATSPLHTFFFLLFKNVLNDLHKDNRKNLRMYSLRPNIFKILQNFMDGSS